MSYSSTVFNKVSTDNSLTIAGLAVAAVQSGAIEFVGTYTSISVNVTITTAETIALTITFGDSTLTVNTSHTVVSGPADKSFVFPVLHPYMQISALNNGSVAVSGDVTTILNSTLSTIAKPLSDDILIDEVVPVNRSILSAQCEFNNFGNVKMDHSGSLLMSIKNPLDNFNRVSVSNSYTAFDYRQLTFRDKFAFDELVSGSGSSLYTPGLPQTIMRVTDGVAGRVVRQSYRYVTYQPGKTLLYMMTGTLISMRNALCISRIGFFDDKSDKVSDTILTGDGFFFEYDGTTDNLYLVHRTSNNPTFTQVDTKVPQASWNIDTLDGNGLSRITIDVTKRQIFVFRMAWLGVGAVIAGLYFGGRIIPCHMFDFTNNTEMVAYSTRGSLPVRYELVVVPGVAAPVNVDMHQICCSVNSEGGVIESGPIFSAGTGDLRRTISTTPVPFMSIRLNRTGATRPRVVINLLKLNVVSTSATNLRITVYEFVGSSINPLVNSNFINATTDAAIEGSAIEYDTQATSVNFGLLSHRKIIDTYMSNNNDIAIVDLSKRIMLDSNIQGYSKLLVVMMETLNSTERIYANLTWQEFE